MSTTFGDYQVVTWESWIQAGRLTLPSGWFERQVMNANAALRAKGWDDIDVVYVEERTSLFERTILFKLRGQLYAVKKFQEGLQQLAGVA